MFQVLDNRGNHFLKLLDDKYLLIKPTYIKDGPWLKQFGYLNSLYARVTRIITNHTFMREYCLRFFPRLNFECPCKLYQIELKQHILHEYKKYNKYWNLNRISLNHFVAFLDYNSEAFFFYEETS